MYQYVSRIRFTEVDQNRKTTLNAILNYFQDCATFQSEDLGVGMTTLESMGRMWVLNSWKIQVHRYPEFGERITVETWPYAFGKMTGQRNFRLVGEDGSVAACADSFWVYMDTKRMRPTRLDELMAIQQEISAELSHKKIGKTFKVIIDRKEGDYYVGRTEFDSPEVDPEVLIKYEGKKLHEGNFYNVVIEDADDFDLYGRVSE